jgi:hypothetical protein
MCHKRCKHNKNNALQYRHLAPIATNKVRAELSKCPKMVRQFHTQNLLILQAQNHTPSLTEKAYFFGRMALWHQITRILSKPQEWRRAYLNTPHGQPIDLSAAFTHDRREGESRP